MGIYDRDYYRDDRRSIFDPFTSRTQVTVTLVIINALVFLFQIATRDGWDQGWFTAMFSLDVAKVQQGEVWRLLTSAFLHSPDSIAHIVFNMLFLWWAGSQVEDIYGSREFLGFYLVAALASGLAYFTFESIAGNPSRAYGASGAVTAVMVVFAMHYPHRTVLLFFVLPVPVWFLVVFQVLNDTLGLIGVDKRPIAFVAHLAGAGFGCLYFVFSWRITNWLPSFGGSRGREGRRRGGPKLKVYTNDPVREPAPAPEPATASAGASGTPAPAGATATKGSMDEHLEAKLDEVLEKVKRHGQDSLSETEREILFRASEIYRKRRQE